MTTEQLLLAAVSAVTGALTFVCNELWARSQRCELALEKLREDYKNLTEEHGIATGALSLYRRCRIAECPFADAPRIVSPS